ncbi:MAG TPA: hypothetical protein VE954_27065 [Oligoflexus sp.]|uniref:hypothetical protein n=1 Tax=Oligoflexus sp. TaxID=1971216 RepID=UPI002D24D050|nr:hypothetical protein [Oligoflexus sp.]HYX36785.1 hypothetical protein [Oligoflexus sp.]
MKSEPCDHLLNISDPLAEDRVDRADGMMRFELNKDHWRFIYESLLLNLNKIEDDYTF